VVVRSDVSGICQELVSRFCQHLEELYQDLKLLYQDLEIPFQNVVVVRQEVTSDGKPASASTAAGQ